MARNWDSLSEPYQHRLERAGIDREAYSRGDSLSEARGHGSSRESLIDQIQAYKIAEHGGKRSFNTERSRKNVDIDTESKHKRSTTELKDILKHYEKQERLRLTRDEMLADEDGDWDDYLDADKYH